MTYADRRRDYLDRRQKHIIAGGAPFDPLSVPEVAAGYIWDPADATGSGTAGFLLPEGGGKTTHDLITPAANTAPVLGTVNGQPVVTYATAVPDQTVRTSAAVSRGSTGATMMWGWFQAPVAPPGTIFSHWRVNNNLIVTIGAIRCDIAGHDGAIKESQHIVAAGYMTNPIYVEALFDPAEVATNRLQFWIDRVQLVPSVAGTMGATMTDAVSFIQWSGSTADSSTFNISNNFAHGVVGLTLGIPSAANRDRMFNHRKLR